MKIKVTKDHSGSPDGLRYVDYRAGQTFEVPSRDMSASLALVFLGLGCAEEAKPIEAKPPAPKPKPKPRRSNPKKGRTTQKVSVPRKNKGK